MENIQSRVGVISKVIANIKQVKIAGIAAPVESLIHNLRLKEIDVGNKFRMVQVIAAVVAFTPRCLSPVLAFAFAGRDLDVTTMYESLSYMILLTSPLTYLFQEIPNILAAFTCLDRIQEFLRLKPRKDFRRYVGYILTQPLQTPGEDPVQKDDVKNLTQQEVHAMCSDKSVSASGQVVISITNGCFRWSSDRIVLNKINTTIRATDITFVVGPVASGKSTLCRAILGDIPLAAGELRYTIHFKRLDTVTKHHSWSMRA